MILTWLLLAVVAALTAASKTIPTNSSLFSVARSSSPVSGMESSSCRPVTITETITTASSANVSYTWIPFTAVTSSGNDTYAWIPASMTRPTPSVNHTFTWLPTSFTAMPSTVTETLTWPPASCTSPITSISFTRTWIPGSRTPTTIPVTVTSCPVTTWSPPWSFTRPATFSTHRSKKEN